MARTDSSSAATRSLSHSETARALRAFIYTSGALGAFAQMVGLQMAVFVGFALWLGASESNIAHFMSVGSFSSLAQLLSSSLLISRIKRKKAFVVWTGCLFVLLRFSVVLIPLVVAPSLRVPAIALLVGVGLGCWHLGAPVNTGWQAQIIPEEIRARFIGRQTVANLAVGIAASYAAGWFLDLFTDADKYTGFLTIFAAAGLIGLYGFLNLTRVPFAHTAEENLRGNLFAPFRDRRFRRLLFFFGSWNFAWSLASSFYNVFMLKTLLISYSTVAIFSSLSMAAMVVGSKVLGGLVDRYGSKAVLQIVVLPTMITPVLWVFNRADLYVLIPVVMLLNGLVFSGILVSVNTLLYGMVPEGRDRTSYFAGWSCAVFLAYAVGPLLGSALVKTFEPIRISLLGFPIGNLQLVFLVSAAAMIVPNILLRKVEDTKGTTAGELLGQIGRGNLVGYVYSSLVYAWTGSEQTRARAARRMGRSKSPMALERLVKALADASPEVRRQAARGLGEARSPDAVAPLLEELKDEESDIRTEAAEALGKIGDPKVVDPLVDALDDPDIRVQISAIRALAEMGGEEMRELLFWTFAEGFERSTFPTLAEVLGRFHDLRMVRPTLGRLDSFRSPAIRLQLLNSVCRALGARRRFYQTISQDELTRAERMDEMLRQTRRAVHRARALRRDIRARIQADLDAVRKAFDTDDGAQLVGAIRKLVEGLEIHIDEDAVDALGNAAAARIGAVVLAVRTFLDQVEIEVSQGAHTVFLIVCIWCIGDALKPT